jgi:ubiquinone/menaquinone biosynthesis C-methylase UbiE
MNDKSFEKRTYQKIAEVYEQRADEYESWYDDSPLFATELLALQSLGKDLPFPRFEIGSGPGRFAHALKATLGIDPAPAALQHGRARGIMGVAGIAEQLPLADNSAGTLFLLFTLCFLADPVAALKECHRVLRADGNLVVGHLQANSPWGAFLKKKQQNGNPFYKYAHFFTANEIIDLLNRTGFTLKSCNSTLFQLPGGVNTVEKPVPGINEQGGFAALLAHKKER